MYAHGWFAQLMPAPLAYALVNAVPMDKLEKLEYIDAYNLAFALVAPFAMVGEETNRSF